MEGTILTVVVAPSRRLGPGVVGWRKEFTAVPLVIV